MIDITRALITFLVVLASSRCLFGQEILDREEPFQVRPYALAVVDDWQGAGISYGPYRDGQCPGGAVPSKEEMREDLHLLTNYWKVLRVYGSTECTPTICQIIREDGLDLKVMVGAWLQSETDRSGDTPVEKPNGIARNREHVDNAILLANQYPDVVAAISVGNEALVDWSGHRLQPERIIQHIRKTRKQTRVPVTVADDYLFWASPNGKPVADELDFLVTHIYAMWHKQQLEGAMAFTKEKFATVKEWNPEKLIVIGEAGWATSKATPENDTRDGRIAGVAGEAEQKIFYDAFTAWAREEHIPTFFFAAFDQNWKGPDDPMDVEKNWGLFRADRTAKPALPKAKVAP